MNDKPRFVRYYMEFEVEITDEMALKVADLNSSVARAGELTGVAQWSDLERQAAYQIFELISDALFAGQDRIGVAPAVLGVPVPRKRDANGDYPEVRIGAVPGRNLDGTVKLRGSRRRAD